MDIYREQKERERSRCRAGIGWNTAEREYSSKLIVMNEPAEWHAVLQQLKLGLVQILCLERVLARTYSPGKTTPGVFLGKQSFCGGGQAWR